MKNKNAITSLIFVFSCLCALACCAPVSASWRGVYGSSGGGSSGGGASPATCRTRYSTYLWKYIGVGDTGYSATECTGVSWVYYRFYGSTSGDSNFTFYPKTAAGNVDTIGQCRAAGGFWHLGYDIKQVNESLWNTAFSNSHFEGSNGKFLHVANNYANTKYLGTSDMSLNYWNSTGVYSHQSGNSPANNGTPHELYHKILVGGSNYYLAEKYGTVADVERDYNAARESGWPVWSRADIYAFCSDGGGGETNFTATNTPAVNGTDKASGTQITVDGTSTVRVGFTIKLKRGNDGPSSAVTNKFKRTGVNSDSSNTSKSFNKNEEKTLYTKGSNYIDINTSTIDPGATKTICQTIKYYPKANSSGPTGSQNGSAEACIKLYRPPLEFNLSAYVEAHCTTAEPSGGDKWTRTCRSSATDVNGKALAHWDGANHVYFHYAITGGGSIAPRYEIKSGVISPHITSRNGNQTSSSDTHGAIASGLDIHYLEWLTVGNTKKYCQTITYDKTYSEGVYSNPQTVSLCMDVAYPYNYNTSIDMPSFSQTHYAVGSTVSATANLGRHYRYDTSVSDNRYSTALKPATKYQAIAFYVDTNTEYGGVGVANKYPPSPAFDASGTIDWVSNCRVLINGVKGNCFSAGSGSPTGGTNAATNTEKIEYNLPISATISNSATVGDKLCVVVGVWPSDSVNDPLNSSVTARYHDGTMNDVAMQNSGWYWHFSAPSCVSISKKPALQIRNGGAYAQNNVNTALSKNAGRLYGSWAEYDLRAGGQIGGTDNSLMASGATLWGGSLSSAATAFTPLTFSNNTSSLGRMPLDANASANPAQLIDQIRYRYVKTSGFTPMADGSTADFVGYCKYDDTTKTYVPRPTGGHLGNFACLSNGSMYEYINGSGYEAGGGTITDEDTGIVLEARDTITIKGNVYHQSSWSSADIPQEIIIAKKIIIQGNVTQLDAWLIADEVDTCQYSTPDASQCNLPLNLNGHIIAKKVNLYRRFGSEGDIKAEPSETINLSPAVYLWSYNESRKKAQAITTFQRELPPKY